MKIKVYTVAAVLVLVPAPAAATSPSEWPQPGYGPGSTYYNPNESRLNAGTIDGIRERWKLPAHGPSLCESGADPVLAGGRLFTTDPGGIGAAGRPVRAGGLLYATSAAAGGAAARPAAARGAAAARAAAASTAAGGAAGGTASGRVAGGATPAIVDAGTGQPEKSGIPGSVDHAPVVAGGRMFTTDGDELRAYY